MLYRQLGLSGIALSAIALRLNWECVKHNKGLMSQMIVAALEGGINHFHFDYACPNLMRLASDIFSTLERRLLFIGLTAHSDKTRPEAMSYTLNPLRERMRMVLFETGLTHIDHLMFDNPQIRGFSHESFDFLQQLRASKKVKYLGVDAPEEQIQTYADNRQFQILRTQFDLDTSWEKRHRLDRVLAANIAIFGHDYFPSAYHNQNDLIDLGGLNFWPFGKPKHVAKPGTYAFLHQTRDWTAEELCLSYALNQSALTCVYIEAQGIDRLEKLMTIPERYLPSSVPAQIEMARFASANNKKRA